MPTTITLPREVEEAIERGWSIIPVRETKQPLTNWAEYQERPATRDQVAQWAAEFNPAAWAVITGKESGVFVLDFDGQDGIDLALELGLVSVAQVYTPSHGLHVYFDAATVSFPVKTRARVFPNMDVRGEKGYAIFHGRALGGKYELLHDTITPEDADIIPLFVVERLHGLQSAGGDRRGDLATDYVPSAVRVPAEILIRGALARFPAKGRNAAGFWLACQLRDNDYTEKEARGIVLQYRDLTPPFNTKGQWERYTRGEVEASVRSAYSVAPRDPWGVRS